MRTSLTRLELIEAYISRNISPGNKIVFEAQLLLDNDLASDVNNQKEAYRIIQQYGRESLRAELEILHQQLQKESKLTFFWNSIHKIFQKN